MKPDGTDVQTLNKPDEKLLPPHAYFHLTADRMTAVYRRQIANTPGPFRTILTLVPLTGTGKPVEIAGYGPSWYDLSADGKTVYLLAVSEAEAKDGTKALVERNWAYNVATGKVTLLPFPERQMLRGVSSDGKLFLTEGPVPNGDGLTWHTYFVGADGKNPVEVFDANVSLSTGSQLSPSGDRILTTAVVFERVTPASWSSLEYDMKGMKAPVTGVIDVATKKMTPLRNLPADGRFLGSLAWSPDGTKIAYVWDDFDPKSPRNLVPGPPGAPPKFEAAEIETRVYAADPDGSNAKVVYKTKSKGSLRTFMWK
jgi:hypothetical protein